MKNIYVIAALCADCGEGVAMTGNLGYHFQVVENVSKNVIKKNLA